MGERGSDIGSLSFHMKYSMGWSLAKAQWRFCPPSCPMDDSGLGTVSGQLMVPRGARLVSFPRLGSSHNNLVEKERVLELCSSEEGIEWPCR